MANYDGWELTGETIGEGGQGRVYKARSPERVHRLRENKERITRLIHREALKDDPSTQAEYAREIVEAGTPDPLGAIGALKVFTIPNDSADGEQAVARLESEALALKKIVHPAVLKLLHCNIDHRFIVTEYHPEGPLSSPRNLNRYKGDVVSALEAFLTLVEGVHEIHQHGAIHRDIKPDNIFVSSTGNLVLGDFGIVFHAEGDRRTRT